MKAPFWFKMRYAVLMVGVNLEEDTVWYVGWASGELVLDGFLSKLTDTRKADCIWVLNVPVTDGVTRRRSF